MCCMQAGQTDMATFLAHEKSTELRDLGFKMLIGTDRRQPFLWGFFPSKARA